MKKFFLILSFISITAYSQFRDSGFPDTSVKDGIVNNSGPSLFGFLGSDNFQMHHTYSLSYSSFGNNGLALGVYTNSMLYRFSDNLNVQADISVMHSPYSSFGKEFQNSLTGIYLSRAALNYSPWKDFQINIQYRNSPAYYPGYYNGYNYYNYYRDPLWGF